MGPTTSEKASAKREAILDAALELFVERGFHGTAVPAVAEKAGVGAGTIYRHFESKEALVNALYQKWKAEISAFCMQAIAPAAPAREQFRTTWRQLTAFVRRHPRAFAFLELHHHASYLDETSRALESRVIDLTRELIVVAQREQAMKPLAPELLMTMVYGAFVAIVRASNEGRLPFDDETLAAAEQCCWEAVRA